jgi:hypothetical protein
VACTARLDGDEIRSAYLATWERGRELMSALADRYDAAPPEAFLERLDGRFAGIFDGIGRERP